MRKVIFVIDDNSSNLTLVAEALSPRYTVMTFSSGKKALTPLEKIKPDIILLDVEMPEMDGFEFLEFLKSKEKYKDIPVIFLTAKSDFPTEIKALEMGVVDFISKPFNPAVLLKRIKHHVDINGLVAKRTAQLYSTRQDIIFALADMVENRDESTGGHLWRTHKLIKELLKNMIRKNIYYAQISDWDFGLIADSSLLHDLGKINTPDHILKKNGKLTEEEWEVMKTHTVTGEKIIDKIIARSRANELLNNAKIFAISHHEKWDGTGYPYGLADRDIPLQGRVMALVDVFDALMSKRVYKEAFTMDESFAIIFQERGKHFDPQITNVFCDIKADIFREIYFA